MIIGVSALVLIAGSAVFYRSLLFLPFALGVFLTCALNCLKVVMLERAVEKAMDKGSGAKGYMGLQYLLRFLLTGIVLALAATQDFISLWGAIAGIFTFPVAALSLKFFPQDFE